MKRHADRPTGFTLLELMIVIAVVGLILVVAAPSIKRYLEAQRLRSVSGELMGDLQFARTESVARARIVGVRFGRDTTRTCYTVAAYSGTNCLAPGDAQIASCDCLLGPGSACSGNWTELKTVTLPTSTAVRVNYIGISQSVAFDPTSGQLNYCDPNRVTGLPVQFRSTVTGDTTAALEVQIAPAGRPRLCVTSGRVAGVPAC